MDDKSKEQIDRLKKGISIMIGEGIYPKSVVGNYDKRTDWMDGWNACNIAIVEKLGCVLKDEDWPEDEGETA